MAHPDSEHVAHLNEGKQFILKKNHKITLVLNIDLGEDNIYKKCILIYDWKRRIFQIILRTFNQSIVRFNLV